MSDPVNQEAVLARLAVVRERLEGGITHADPHHRLRNCPVSYHLVAGRTLEVAYRDVPRIEEFEILAMKRLVGEQCYCIVEPQTAETLTVRLVVPLDGS
jgi:hypothetical protein